MSAQNRFQRAAALFRAACELPHEAQEAYLVQACGEDETILHQVRNMLAADQSSRGVLDEPAAISAANAIAFPAGGGIPRRRTSAAIA